MSKLDLRLFRSRRLSMQQAASFRVARRSPGAFRNTAASSNSEGRLGMSGEVQLLKRVYGQFNARDIESVLAAMHHDVIWANGMDGGHVHGRDEVRKYWTRQWTTLDPRVEPVAFSPGHEGEI